MSKDKEVPLGIKNVTTSFYIDKSNLDAIKNLYNTNMMDFTYTYPLSLKFNYEQEKRGTALVFGAGGQVGSYLCEHLLDKNYDVVAVIRRSSVSNTERIDHLRDKIKIVEGDVTDTHSVHNLITEHKPTHIFNMAAMSHVGTSFKQPVQTWDSTATGVLNILNAIVNIDKSIRFCQASTSEMFGKNYSEKIEQTGYDEETDEFGNPVEVAKYTKFRYQDEETEFMPQSPYAVAKLAAHHMIRLYRDSYGIFASAIIMFNNESSRRGENFVTRKITKYLGRVLRWMDENAEYPLSSDIIGDVFESLPFSSDEIKRCKEAVGSLELGNLDAKRDWGHSKDYSMGAIMMLEHDKPDDFVLATGETRSVRDFLSIAFGYCGLDYNDFVEINPEFFRPAEVDYLKGNPTKAVEVLGWERKHSFEDLVKEMVISDWENG